MSATASERLYQLLPSLFRVRDARAGESLRALLAVVDGELRRIEGDIETLYDNWFIETCEAWVVPYIGDLLRVRPIRSVESAGVSVRAYVANTLDYRRRKGTAAVLEQLARDTTGWAAHAVEFFARLATTQHVNHVRLAPPATAAIRDAEAAELVGSAFDPLAHTADVRRIATGRGRHNIPNVGIFLWRLGSYRIGRGGPDGALTDFGTARRDSSGAYFTFHPVGLDAVLFNEPRTEETITHLAGEENVPGRLRRLALHEELERIREELERIRAGEDPAVVRASLPGEPPRFLTEATPVFRVLVELAAGAPPVEIPREQIFMCEIPDELDLASPPAHAVAVDPKRGRLAFPPTLDPSRVFVTFNYGFSGDLGGGPYDRTGSIEEADRIEDAGPGAPTGVSRRGFLDEHVWQAGVSHLGATAGASGQVFGSLREAVAAWNGLSPVAPPDRRAGVIAVMDSLTEHDVASPDDPIVVAVGQRSSLLIVAANWPLEEDPKNLTDIRRRPGRLRAVGVRPHYVGDLVVRGTAPLDSPDPGDLFVNGLLIEGGVRIADGHLGLLEVDHCTLVPERGGLAVGGGNERLRVTLRRSITGPLSVPVPIRALQIADCIAGGASGSPDAAVVADTTETDIQRSTIFGAVLVQTISASDCIFDGPVTAGRRQVGCVRFSYVPAGSTVPRRYRCQPDAAVAARVQAAREAAAAGGMPFAAAAAAAISAAVTARVVPAFVSRRYGDPEYAQLALRCAAEIRAGAEGGREMGAFCFLEQPQRDANLRGALDEYLRLGLEVGVFYVT